MCFLRVKKQSRLGKNEYPSGFCPAQASCVSVCHTNNISGHVDRDQIRRDGLPETKLQSVNILTYFRSQGTCSYFRNFWSNFFTLQ